MEKIKFEIEPEMEGVRIDKCIAAWKEDVSRSYIQKLIEQGNVTVNGLSVKAKAVPKIGDVVEVLLPEPIGLTIPAEPIPLSILYEDADVILMDEPTSSIDYQYIDRFIRYLNVLKERGKTIVFSCHNPSIPLLLNANVFVLADGQLKYSGEARTLLNQETLCRIYDCEFVSTSELPYNEYSIQPIDL